LEITVLVNTVNIVRREMFLCISTNPCPGIARCWDAGRKTTVDDLKAVGSTAGFDVNMEGTCTPPRFADARS